MNTLLFFYYTLRADSVDSTQTNTQQTISIFEQMKDQAFEQDYDPNATANLYYLVWHPLIQKTALTTDEAAALYSKEPRKEISQEMQDVYSQQLELAKQKYRSNPKRKANVLGNFAVSEITSSFMNFFIHELESVTEQLYDLQSYILLVNAKHQIISKNLKTNEIDAYLKQAGTATQNPITREQFTWNTEKNTLNTPWVSQALPANVHKDTPQLNAAHIPLTN